jgi:hypothetical protein
MVLNMTGSRIWELSDGSRDAPEVAASLVERFDVTFDRALEDVRRFYAEMIGAGTMEAVS